MAIVLGEAHTVLSEARVAVAAWVREDLHLSDDVVADLVSLLDEDILLTALRPKGVRLPKKLEARNFRYLWRRVVAHQLGWRERRSEGDEGSFTASVNSALRRLWPDRASEDKNDGQSLQAV